MNVVCYKRVSTEEQRLHGYGLMVQERSMLDWCERNNHNILEVFTEDYSGKDFDRPTWNKLMKYVKDKKNKVDIVLCYRWDRLGRNLVESIEVINTLGKLNIIVQSSDQEMEMNSDDPDMLFMKVLHLTFPEVENKKISKRTIEGMRGGMGEGCWMGRAPIGYDNFKDEDDKKSTLVPNEKSVFVKEAFEKMASGVYSANEIRQLFKEKGFRVGKQTVLNMIRNVAYIGKIKINATKNEPERIVIGLHPPIVSEDVFYRANDVLNGRKPNMDFESDKTDLYPLKGFLMCPVHHTSLTAYACTGRKGKKYHYYLCCKCKKEQRHKLNDVHKSVEEILGTIQFSTETIKTYRKTLEKLFDREDINRKSDIEKLKQSIEKEKQRKTNLQYKYLDDNITTSDYKNTNENIETKIRSFQEQLDKLNNGITPFKNYITKEVPMLENLVQFYHNADGRTKRKILNCIFSGKMILEKGKVVSTPFSEGVQLLFKISDSLKQHENKQEVISDLLNMDISSKILLQLEV